MSEGPESNSEGWTDQELFGSLAPPDYSLVVKMSALRDAQIESKPPPFVFPPGWPPMGWESNDTPLNDSQEAIRTWFELVTFPQWGLLVTQEAFARQTKGFDADCSAYVRDAWRLARHLKAKGWRVAIEEKQGQYNAHDALVEVERLKEKLFPTVRPATTPSDSVPQTAETSGLAAPATAMSNPLSLIHVVKQLGRDWRTRAADETPATPDSVREYLTLPISKLLSSIEKHTQHSFTRAQLEHFAWYSDRPLDRMPPLPHGAFITPDLSPEELSLPEDYATGEDLRVLRMIRDELVQCDRDGRTAAILAELKTAHPGTLKSFDDVTEDRHSISASLEELFREERKKALRSPKDFRDYLRTLYDAGDILAPSYEDLMANWRGLAGDAWEMARTLGGADHPPPLLPPIDTQAAAKSAIDQLVAWTNTLMMSGASPPAESTAPPAGGTARSNRSTERSKDISNNELVPTVRHHLPAPTHAVSCKQVVSAIDRWKKWVYPDLPGSPMTLDEFNRLSQDLITWRDSFAPQIDVASLERFRQMVLQRERSKADPSLPGHPTEEELIACALEAVGVCDRIKSWLDRTVAGANNDVKSGTLADLIAWCVQAEKQLASLSNNNTDTHNSKLAYDIVVQAYHKANDASAPLELAELFGDAPGRTIPHLSAQDITQRLRRLRQWATTSETVSADLAGMSWQEAADRLTRLRAQGEPWTSYRTFADQFGCSSATIKKAVDRTPELHSWAKRQPAPRAHQGLGGPVIDNAPQQCELDPEDSAAIREFIESADDETRAWFHALPPEKQLEVVNDPDKHSKTFPKV